MITKNDLKLRWQKIQMSSIIATKNKCLILSARLKLWSEEIKFLFFFQLSVLSATLNPVRIDHNHGAARPMSIFPQQDFPLENFHFL